jgi:hypothetical protein
MIPDQIPLSYQITNRARTYQGPELANPIVIDLTDDMENYTDTMIELTDDMENYVDSSPFEDLDM